MWLCFIPITVRGVENIKGLRSAVFVSNHQSMLDIFMMIGYIPRNAGFLAKKQVIWVPIIGWLLILFGHIRVDRSNPRESLKSVQRCIKAIRSGWSIFIFPEGTRTDDGSIRSFKSGSLKIPLRTGAPVVPVTLAGAYKVMRKKTMAVKPSPIVMHIGEPIPTEELEVKDFKAFVASVERKIRERYDKIITEFPQTAPN
jgi:1-acyl-sn-glycerol-3-phosphate acyltransferase